MFDEKYTKVVPTRQVEMILYGHRWRPDSTSSFAEVIAAMCQIRLIVIEIRSQLAKEGLRYLNA
jgi:hypothetical protein